MNQYNSLVLRDRILGKVKSVDRRLRFRNYRSGGIVALDAER